MILLCSLPDSYGNLSVALESRAETFTMEFVTARLLHEERKRNENPDINTSSVEKAMVSTTHFKLHYQGAKPRRKKGKFINCGLEGDWAKQCQKPKKTISVGRKTEHANITVSNEPSDDSPHYLFLTTSDDEKIEGTSWCVDSGASQHMINKREFIENYREFLKPEIVRLGDDREVKAYGKGNISVKPLNSGGICKSAELEDVLYVPALTKNLLSLSGITRKGYSISFGKEKFVVLNNEGAVLVSEKLNGKLYELDTAVLDKSLHSANSANLKEVSEEIWHQRYGHLNKKSLRDLQSQNPVDGIAFNFSKNEIEEACEGCLKGKQIRQPFPKKQANR